MGLRRKSGAWGSRIFGVTARYLLFGVERNNAYGHSTTLREYAGVKLPYAVPREIQHGWYGQPGRYGDLHYAWNSKNLKWCSDSGYENVVAIGAPFLYLPPPESALCNSLGERSLVLFPMHSTPYVPFLDPARIHREYLDEIRELSSKFNPITVCLHWFEYEKREVIRLFADEGIAVASCGHRDDPSFLKRFRDLTAKHAYASSHCYCTAIFYALYMRKKVFIFGETPTRAEVEHKLPQAVGHPSDDDLYSQVYPELLWCNFNDTSHYWIGEYELGLEFKRSPRELRRLFGWTPINVARQFLKRLLLGFASRSKQSLQAIRQIAGLHFSTARRLQK